METLDISDEVEDMLQDAHDDEFEYVPAKRYYYDRCVTCNDGPLWGCKLFGCSETQSCFIICPSCGQLGFESGPADFVGDEVLAKMLRKALDRPEPVVYTDETQGSGA